jgi:D-glycero-D-manno-heptose 1,7-bisphosphate phosphatase
MMLMAADGLELDLARSWIIGDHASDLEAGMRAGLAGGMHVLTGHGTHHGERQAALALDGTEFQALAAQSIPDAHALVPLLGAGQGGAQVPP